MKISKARAVKWNRWLTIAVLLTAWLLLQFRLNDIPPGFQHDQTFDSLDALQVVGGHFPIYFNNNYGLDPGFMYAAAGVFRLAGGHYVWALRFTSTIFAVLGLAVSLAFARRYLRPGPALFAIALMGGSFWFLFAGRLGLEPAALLPGALLFFYFLLVAQERPRLRGYLLAGVLGGLAIYTYLASRTLFALPVLLLGYEIATAGWRRLRRRLTDPDAGKRVTGLLSAFLAMLVVSGPLLAYLFTNRNHVDQRIGELNGPLQQAMNGHLLPLAQSVIETARVLLWDGTTRLLYHYNLPGRAVLQPVLAACFLIGLAVSIVRLRERKEFFLLAVLLLGLAPTLLTSSDAIFMRSIYALPLVFIVAVRGGMALITWAAERASRLRAAQSKRLRVAAAVLATVIVVAVLVAHYADNTQAYFREWAEDLRVQRIYNGDFRLAATFIDQNAAAGDIFIGTDRMLAQDSETYRLYEPRRTDARWFRLPGNPPLPASGGGIYLAPTTAKLPPLLELLVGAGASQEVLHDTLGRPLMWVVRATPEVLARVAEDGKLRPVAQPVDYESTLRLDAVGWQDRGDKAAVLTRWTTLGRWPRTADPGLPLLQPKVHLSIKDSADFVWASVHAPVLLPVHTAAPGEPLMELTEIPLPPDMPPGHYSVELVLYDDKGGPLAMAQGSAAPIRTPIPVATLDLPRRPRSDAPAAPFAVGASQSGPVRPLGRWEAWDKLLAGVPTPLHVSWQAGTDLETAGLAFRIAAHDQDGNLLWQQLEPAQDLGPTWEAGRTYRLTHGVKPKEGAAGSTTIRLSICAEQQGRVLGCASEESVQVITQPALMALARPPQHPLDAQIDENLRLVGYDLDQAAHRWTVALYWNVLAPPDRPLKRFIHLVAADDTIVAQSDLPLENHGIPTPSWRPGEYVVDTQQFELNGDVQVRRVCTGVYDARTERRLPIRGAGGEPLPDGRLCFDVAAP